jgi:hypothetical protein
MARRNELSQIPGDLWTVSIKLRALGEVFSMAKGEPPFGEEALKGISSLLCDMADDLSDIREALEYPSQAAGSDEGS